jgi:molybdopterin converting factor small subunit
LSTIKILFFAGLREIIQTSETGLIFCDEEVTLHDVILKLLEKFERLNEIIFQKIPQNQIDGYLGNEIDFPITNVKFARNRKIIAHADQNVIFKDGDVIAIFLPLIGG